MIDMASEIAVLAHEIDFALRRGSHSRMAIPQRHVIITEDDRAFVSMSAVAEEFGVYVTKVATVFPRKDSLPSPAVNAVVVAFSTETGKHIATIDGIALTNLKCAAVAAFVTDYCAPRGKITLAILGGGVQARQQVKSVAAVRELSELRIWARNEERRALFAAELRREHRDVQVTEHDSVEEAIDGVDIVGTTTSATTPLSTFERLSASAHVNVMGGHTLVSREVPERLLRTSLVIVEDVNTAVAEAGAVHAEAIELEALPRLGRDALCRRRTIFSSTGHASLDALAAVHVLRRIGILPSDSNVVGPRHLLGGSFDPTGDEIHLDCMSGLGSKLR
jgi:ornithine cyclodeaminase